MKNISNLTSNSSSNEFLNKLKLMKLSLSNSKDQNLNFDQLYNSPVKKLSSSPVKA